MIAALALSAALSAAPAAEPPRSVYRIHPADWAVIGAGALASFLPWALEDDIIDLRCPCDPDEVPRFERFAIGLESDAATAASNVTVALAVLVPPAADLLVLGWSRPLLEDAVVLAETLAVNGAVVTVVKYAVQRPIPLAYAGDPHYVKEPGSYRAFWSGHASTTFAALTAAAWTIRLRHGERVWPWIVAGVVGASVAVERVAGGHHFPSDVVVGALAGAALGTAIPLLHARREEPALSIVPARRGLALRGRF